MIRIKDIAEMCGVSTATVSNVLHGKDHKVSADVKKRVKEAIEKSGYISNAASIAAANTKSDLIGVVVMAKNGNKDVMEDPYFCRLFRHLEQELRKREKYMMLIIGESDDQVLVSAARWNMEGLIICNLRLEDLHEITSRFEKPVVTIDALFQYDCETVVQIKVDDVLGGYQVGTYLTSMGHRKVAMVADNDEAGDHFRWQGFKKALEQAHIRPDESQHLLIDVVNHTTREELERIFPLLKEKTAVFCASDYYAFECAQFCRTKGLQIPEDISIVGFDNLLFSELFWPPLTTVHQNIDRKAECAVESLIAMLEHKKVKRQQIIPVSLVERYSVKKI